MKITLTNVILSMPVLDTPSAFDEKSDEKYSAHFLIEKDDSVNLPLIKQALASAAERAFKAKAAAMLKSIQAAGKQFVLRDGDGKVNKDGEVIKGYAGRLYVSAKNKERPTLVDSDARTLLAAKDGKFYAGAVVNAIIEVVAGDKPSAQAYAYLGGIQFVKHGERLGGGGVAAVGDFKPVATPKGAAKSDGSDVFGNIGTPLKADDELPY
jgi:hypothetical protein